MKRGTFCLLLLLTISFSVQAQVKEGKIVYECKTNLHRKFPDGDERRLMLPQFVSEKWELLFSSNQTLFRQVQEEEENAQGNPKDAVVFTSAGGAMPGEIYADYATGLVVEQRELGPKKYLIEDSLKSLPWVEKGETKTIKGFVCKKATVKGTEGKQYTAWYTDALPTGSPEKTKGLNGMILELDINDGEVVYAALQIGKTKAEIKKPAKGKKITQAEYEQLAAQEFGPVPAGAGAPIRRPFKG
jgi:GLPGLI family protein